MYDQILRDAIEAVKAAESVVLHYFGTDVHTELKDDQSPVTVADREAEATIKQVLSSKYPDHTFYGEESDKPDLVNHRGFTWIIDPIDGTKSYVRGNPLFATELALLHDGAFVVGVSNAPVLHECMAAAKGSGCTLNGRSVQVSDISDMHDAYLSFGSLKHFNAAGLTSQLVSLCESVRWPRGIGDFWSYHLLAQGKLDIMAEASTKLWDIAACKVIVEEAGGRFTTLDGSAVGPGTSSALATNGRLHDPAIAAFQHP